MGFCHRSPHRVSIIPLGDTSLRTSIFHFYERGLHGKAVLICDEQCLAVPFELLVGDDKVGSDLTIVLNFIPRVRYR